MCMIALGLIVQVSAFASGCPWHAQTQGSSAGSPAAWSPAAHTEKLKNKNKKLSVAIVFVVKTTAELCTEVSKNILVSSSHLRPDLLQLLLPLAELRLQVRGPPLSQLLLPVQLQSALLQHALQLRLLLQQQAPGPSTTHKHSLPCLAWKGDSPGSGPRGCSCHLPYLLWLSRNSRWRFW